MALTEQMRVASVVAIIHRAVTAVDGVRMRMSITTKTGVGCAMLTKQMIVQVTAVELGVAIVT